MNARRLFSLLIVAGLALSTSVATAQTTSYLGDSMLVSHSYGGGYAGGCGCGSDLWAGYCSQGCDDGCHDPCARRCKLFGGLFRKRSCEPTCGGCDSCGDHMHHGHCGCNACDPCGQTHCRRPLRHLLSHCKGLFHRHHHCCDTCGMQDCGCGSMSHGMPHETMYEMHEATPAMPSNEQALPLNSSPEGEALPMPNGEGASLLQGPLNRPISFPRPAFRLPSIGR